MKTRSRTESPGARWANFSEDQEQAVILRPSLRGTMKPAPCSGCWISLRLNPSETVAVET